MGRYNDGMIYTNDKCVACNHCVHVCPSVGANVSTNNDGKISIDVSDKNCIHCGRCIRECFHDARHYNDDFDDLLRAVRMGAEISVIVDPTFEVAYGEKKARQVFGYLKSLGIKGIYNGGIGGEISMLCHVKYLRENLDEHGKCDKYFAHTCPGFSNFVSRYAMNVLDSFIPVQLPAVCAAIYYRKYKKVPGRFALLTPCTAINDELLSFSSGRNINYILGYSNLLKNISSVDLSGYDSGYDIEYMGKGSIICENQSFSSIAARYFSPKFMFNARSGLDKNLEAVLRSDNLMAVIDHPTMLVVDMCNTGCIDGPAIHNATSELGQVLPNYFELYEKSMEGEDDGEMSPDQRYQNLLDKFSDINTLDFMWEGDETYRQKCSVPESVVEEIFESMHKDTPDKKKIDCQACGYKSCYELVCAVANGYSRIEDCVHYLNDALKIQLGLDSLTGLYNTRGFIRAATRLVADNPDKKYILIVGDINGLGGINDLYGNVGGDMVINHVAKLLEEFSDKRGECARLGAGTFGCIFENTEDNMIKFRADTVLSVSHLGIDYPLSLKFGMYEMNDYSVPMGRAILYATYAFRTSKDRSKNTYVLYTDKMSKIMSEEAEITQKMKGAMRNSEFVLYFQPKYDHLTGKPVGAEALSRWIKPDGSIVSPGLFIPVFEKNGFITELDRYVWSNSFERVSAWRDEHGATVPVSVNISRISLLDEGIIKYIDDLHRRYPDATDYIQFEITESAYAGDVNEIFDRVQLIRDMGFKVNMDDFGSGYSSLNLLKDAPIDVVKLDMGFLRGEDKMGRGNVIISSVVNMTKELGFDIIAEGVETKEQADMLTGMGCNVIQGYFYAKPMPEEEFVKLL